MKNKLAFILLFVLVVLGEMPIITIDEEKKTLYGIEELVGVNIVMYSSGIKERGLIKKKDGEKTKKKNKKRK